MNKKGFTLIEMIGAIIILGVISIIAYATYTSSLRGFRDDYYVEIVRTLEESGKEFFNDNRNYRPQTMLGAQKVSISRLSTEGFLDEVNDYNGDKCGRDSYVLIVKEGKDDYSYHACLVCQGDDFDNRNDKYCDSAWLDPTTVEYGLGSIEPLYVYKGTPRGELRSLLEVSISYIKKDHKGNVLGEVRGTGYDDVPTILPTNIDIIDTNKVGEYIVDYEYNGETAKGKVIVYENNEPNFQLKFKNEVAGNLSGTKILESGNYVSGEWKQRIFLKISQNGTIIEPGVRVSRFQWNKDGRWQDLCIMQDSGACVPQGAYLKVATDSDMNGYFEIVNDMNEEIEFRMVASNGKISRVTVPTVIKRDNTDPTCELVTSGNYGDNSWYVTDVGITFKTKYDVKNVVNDDKAVSGEKVSNITISTGSLSRTVSNTSQTHKTDTTNVEYRGYIEDQAGNFHICKVSFKRDTVDPVCELNQSGKKGDNDWYVSDVDVTFKTNTDATSGVYQYGLGDYTGSKSTKHTQDIKEVTYTGYIKDYAGHTSTCKTTFKKDATKPICELQKEGKYGDNSWYVTDVDISFKTNTDAMSGVYQYGINDYTGSRKITHKEDTRNVTYTGYIKDYAGNTNTCEVTFKKDAADPVCEFVQSGKKGDNDWYVGDVDISFKTNNDTTSGVYQYGISSYTGVKKLTHTQDTTGVTYTGYIKDYAGHTSTCTTTFKKDATKPVCALQKEGKVGDNSWYISDVDVSFKTNTDATSGVYQYGINDYTGSKKLTHKNDIKTITYTGYIKDYAGNTNTCDVTFKKDATKPVCEFSQKGTKGDNDWYIGNVDVTFKTSSDAMSGVYQYGIGDYTGVKSINYTQDTTGVTYTGYIKDYAGLTSTCTTTFKKDETKPVCELQKKGTIGENSWYTTDVDISFKTNTDATSGVYQYGINDYTGSRNITHKNDTDGITYTGYIKDYAGNKTTCTTSFKKDGTSPTCGHSGDSTSWVNTSRTIKWTCSDNLSGCNSSYSGGSKTYTSTKKTDTISQYTIKDKAGNKVTCPSRTADVYVDTIKPTISLSLNPGKYHDTRTLTVTGSDSDSGVSKVSITGDKSKTVNGNSASVELTEGRLYTVSASVTDNANNSESRNSLTYTIYVTCVTGFTSNGDVFDKKECYVNVSNGKYKPNPNSSTTRSCPAGTYRASHVSYYGDDDYCNKCPAGTYSTTEGASTIDTCKNCPAGTYSGSSGSSSCDDCSYGKYSSQGRSTRCSECPTSYPNGIYKSTSIYDCYKNYTATFYPQNGGSYETRTCSVNYNGTSCSVTTPSTPSRSGYNFEGWGTYSSATSGLAANKSVTIYSNTSYYATWSPKCDAGYTLQSNGMCKGTYISDVVSECPSGTQPSGSVCEKRTKATTENVYTGGCAWNPDNGTMSPTYNQDGCVYERDLPTCNAAIKGTVYKVYDCGEDNVSCKTGDHTYNCSTSCSSTNKRYTYKKYTCECSGILTSKKTCSSGYLDGDDCVTTSNPTTKRQCNSGDTLDSDGITCITYKWPN